MWTKDCYEQTTSGVETPLETSSSALRVARARRSREDEESYTGACEPGVILSSVSALDARRKQVKFAAER